MERETTPNNIAETFLSVVDALKAELGSGVEFAVTNIRELSEAMQSTAGDFLSMGTSATVEAK